MCGRNDKVICPYCGLEHFQSFGCATKYYRVNKSTHSFTTVKCPGCGNEFWYCHNPAVKTKEKLENDELEWTSTVCW